MKAMGRMHAAPIVRPFWTVPALVLAAGVLVLGLTRLLDPPSPRTTPAPLERLALAYGPLDFNAALTLADNAVLLGEERVARRPQDWIYQESIARALLGRARLTQSFDDLARAGAALTIGKAEAIAGSGPMLTDAVFNFTIHRAGPIAADLAVVDGAAVPADPGDLAESIALKGDVAFYAGNYAGAIKRYGEAARISNGPGTMFRIALWQKKTGNFDAAIASFARAAAINTGRTRQFMANVELQSGIVELERGNWQAAEAWFVKADRTFPGYWLIEAHVAQMAALRGDMRGAALGYRHILAHAAQPDVMDALGALYRAMGNAAESRHWAAQSAPVWARRLLQLPEAAYAHALEHELVLGDPVKALVLARLNMTARPYGDSATLLGWALLANNRAAEARDTLEALNRSGWCTAQQYIALSQAYALLGDSKRSDAALQTALQINPRAADPAASLIWFGHH